MTASTARTVRLRPLSMVAEGDDVLVGDPETGTFVTIPAIGGVVIAALQRGASIDEVAAEAQAAAGEPVDVAGFVAVLTELGFVDDGSGPRDAVRTAPIQGRRWLRGVNQNLARPLFGPVAWTCYALLAVFSAAVFATQPDLFPSPARDAFLFRDIGLSAILLVPLSTLMVALHEGGHWLAARAIGLRSRFGVDRRIMLLVFETDLTQVWSVPRRRRYSPLLGGMAIDVTLLGIPLGGRLLIHTGLWSTPPTADAILATIVYLSLANLLWQSMIFLRTDLYAVLVNLLGCHNLWQVKTLMLRQAFRRLTPDQTEELSRASAADRRTARWFRWVWLAGFAGVLGWFTLFVLPVIEVILTWTTKHLAAGPLAGQFWYALLCATLLLGPYLLAAALAIKEYAQRARSTTPT
jgi:putative peptide zinc metalloprotease protein